MLHMEMMIRRYTQRKSENKHHKERYRELEANEIEMFANRKRTSMLYVIQQQRKKNLMKEKRNL